MYGAVYEPSLDAAFRAAEAHGIRAVIGKVMMDRLTYDETRRPSEVLDLSLRQSADLCDRWHMRDNGRLRYAFTPRFAVSCSAEMLRESAALAKSKGAYWQTHLAEDRAEIAEVARALPRRPRLPRRLRPGRRPRARGRSSPTRSTCRTARSPGWPRPARTSPTARPRTCSWRRGSCRLARLPRGGHQRRPRARTWPAARTSRSSARCASGVTSRTRCGSPTGDPRPILDSVRLAAHGHARRRPAAWASRTRSARSRRARRPT